MSKAKSRVIKNASVSNSATKRAITEPSQQKLTLDTEDLHSSNEWASMLQLVAMCHHTAHTSKGLTFLLSSTRFEVRFDDEEPQTTVNLNARVVAATEKVVRQEISNILLQLNNVIRAALPINIELPPFESCFSAETMESK